MPIRKRVDRFIEDALVSFGERYLQSDWLGKERDCVNVFAHSFLAKGCAEGATISDVGQIKIECSVLQLDKYPSNAVCKDLVVWDTPFETTWNDNWEAIRAPRAIVEWKTKRGGRVQDAFDAHDTDWLITFTFEHPETFGYLVNSYSAGNSRNFTWLAVKRGEVLIPERRS